MKLFCQSYHSLCYRGLSFTIWLKSLQPILGGGGGGQLEEGGREHSNTSVVDIHNQRYNKDLPF